MTVDGTRAYDGRTDVPALVAAAVRAARTSGFTLSCLPAQGELLRLLAAGTGPSARIGETGTGCGVGLAWLASGAFGGTPNVEVLTGDWRPGGVLVIDDFAPTDDWPPTYQGEPDRARLHWLCHPSLLATQIRVTPEMATVVATYVDRHS